jgi:hypothetical protein
MKISAIDLMHKCVSLVFRMFEIESSAVGSVPIVIRIQAPRSAEGEKGNEYVNRVAH